MKPSGIQV